jgi:transposase
MAQHLKYRRKKSFESINRRRKVALLYLRKMHQREIAEELKIGMATVHRDIEAIEKRWLEETKKEVSVCKAEALANLDVLEVAAWRGEDLNLVLKVLQEKNKINGVYAPEKVEGEIKGGVTIMKAIKWALTLNKENPEDDKNKEISDVEYKRLT